MKATTVTTLEYLQNPTIDTIVQNHETNSPEAVYGDITVSEAARTWESVRIFILEEINNGIFDSLTFSRRSGINSAIKGIIEHPSDPIQFIQQIDNLSNQLILSGLYYRKIGKKDLVNEIRQITKAKSLYTKFMNNFDSTKKNLELIDRKKKEIDAILETSDEHLNQLAAYKDEAKLRTSDIDSSLTHVQERSDAIKQIEQEIETKRLGINTFHENIEEYKKSISDLETKVKGLLEQDSKVKELIKEAEEALKLKSAQGISAAFSAQYEAACRRGLYIWWVIGALFLLLIAVGLTVWIIGGWGIQKPDALSSILGRVFAVAITVSGATFCARQYVKQKNIAEDYAYKAVLSKSIVAFADRIEASDDDNDTQVAEYLRKVLHEIHKDPLRSRKDNQDYTPVTEKTVEIIEKLSSVFKK